MVCLSADDKTHQALDAQFLGVECDFCRNGVKFHSCKENNSWFNYWPSFSE